MSNLLIYQMFHRKEDISKLDSAFIPLDNTVNAKPHLFEYPIQKKLFFKHKDSNDYWGLVSAKWYEKTCLPGKEFEQWILDNPDYDVYHIDPNIHESILYHNLWVQGEQVHDGPMMDFANKMFAEMDMSLNVRDISIKPEHFATTSYYVGNAKFWKEWYLFLDYALVVCSQNEELHDFLYKTMAHHRDYKVPFFIFVVERLLTMFFITNTSNIKVKKFPIEHECYHRLLTDNNDYYNKTIGHYKRLNEEYDEKTSGIWTYRV
jgi:hypothetical protein